MNTLLTPAWELRDSGGTLRDFLRASFPLLLITASLVGCGGGSGGTSQTPRIIVTVSGPSTPLNATASRTFNASVSNSSNAAVTWSVVEAGCGSITEAGLYIAPPVPGTYTAKVTWHADLTALGVAKVVVAVT